MIYNFKTQEDGQQWVVDTEALTWGRASSIVAAPSVTAVENNLARFVPTEEGRLIPMGGNRFALEGRKPFDENNKPQLALVVILTVLSGDNNGTCVTLFQSNVAVTDVQHQQIKNFYIQPLPPFRLNPKGVGKIHAVDSEPEIKIPEAS